MKVFFDEFPNEIIDAAKVDGLSSLGILTYIVIPLAAPAVATVVLFSLIAGWNDFLFSLAFSQTIKSMPATVALANMDTGYKVYWGAMMAGGTLILFPIMIIAFVLQKYFVQGLIKGAIK